MVNTKANKHQRVAVIALEIHPRNLDETEPHLRVIN